MRRNAGSNVGAAAGATPSAAAGTRAAAVSRAAHGLGHGRRRRETGRQGLPRECAAHTPRLAVAGNAHGRRKRQPTIHSRLQLPGDLTGGGGKGRNGLLGIGKRPAHASPLVGKPAYEGHGRRQGKRDAALVHDALELLLDTEEHRSRLAARHSGRPGLHLGIGQRRPVGVAHERPGAEGRHERRAGRLAIGAQAQLFLVQRLLYRAGDHGTFGRIQVQARDARAPIGVPRHGARIARRRLHGRPLTRHRAVFLLHALEHAVVGHSRPSSFSTAAIIGILPEKSLKRGASFQLAFRRRGTMAPVFPRAQRRRACMYW